MDLAAAIEAGAGRLSLAMQCLALVIDGLCDHRPLGNRANCFNVIRHAASFGAFLGESKPGVSLVVELSRRG